MQKFKNGNSSQTEMKHFSRGILAKNDEIMVEKKTNRLNELLEDLEKDSSTQKYIDEFLISEIYTNLNDEENAKKYADLAKEHVLHPED